MDRNTLESLIGQWSAMADHTEQAVKAIEGTYSIGWATGRASALRNAVSMLRDELAALDDVNGALLCDGGDPVTSPCGNSCPCGSDGT